MFSLFCGPTKSRTERRRNRHKRNGSFLSSAGSSIDSNKSSGSENSSCYRYSSPLVGRSSIKQTPDILIGGAVRGGDRNRRNCVKSSLGISLSAPATHCLTASLSSRSALDLRDTSSNCTNNGYSRSVYRVDSNISSNLGATSEDTSYYDDNCSTSNLSVIDRINRLTGTLDTTVGGSSSSQSPSIFHNKYRQATSTTRRPKSMMTSSFKNMTTSADEEKCPLKRAHSTRFKGGGGGAETTIHEHEEDEMEMDVEKNHNCEANSNFFERLQLFGFHNNNDANSNEIKCKLRRTRSGVSSRSTRRSIGSTTNLSAVEKLSVSV